MTDWQTEISIYPMVGPDKDGMSTLIEHRGIEPDHYDIVVMIHSNSTGINHPLYEYEELSWPMVEAIVPFLLKLFPGASEDWIYG